MQYKTAYVIRTGDLNDGRDVSHKLCNRQRAYFRVRAAIRMGHKNAYMAPMAVSRDSRLLGDKLPVVRVPQGMTAAERDALKRYAADYATAAAR